MARLIEHLENTDGPSSDYPYGRVRDNTGGGNGTPANEKGLGDMHQFFAKLMAEAGITANGLPDNDYSGFQLFEALTTHIANRVRNNLQATEALRGSAELATQTETNTGTDDTRIVTPLKLATTPLVLQHRGGIISTSQVFMSVIGIPSWNMDTVDTLSPIDLGIINLFGQVLGVNVQIQADDNAGFKNLLEGGTYNIASDSSTITLSRTTSGVFDNTGYDSTAFGRGRILLFWYIQI